MKNLIFKTAIVMLAVFAISTTTQGQTLQYPKKVNGSWINATIDGSKQFETSSGTMTGQQIAQQWANVYQQEMQSQQPQGNADLPQAPSNNQNSQFVAQSNQQTLLMQQAQIEKTQAETKAIKTTNTLNVVTTVANVAYGGVQVYNNTRMTGAYVKVLNNQFANNGNNNGGYNYGNGNGTNGNVQWYNNNDGLGPFYVGADGMRHYGVPPTNTIVSTQYSGQTPTNNGGSNNTAYGYGNNSNFQQPQIIGNNNGNGGFTQNGYQYTSNGGCNYGN